MTLVAPHGGTLVDRVVAADRIAALTREAAALPRLTLDARELSDLELIATGAASPLTGFLGEADYRRVLAELRLASGVVWPVPLTLAIPDAQRPAIEAAGAAALFDGDGRLWGVIRVASIYQRDPIVESRALYGTDDVNHPGVAYTLSRPRWLAGGDVDVLPLPALPFAERRLSPRALRAKLAALGWTRVAGFQTRSPIHRAHEHLTRLALEVSDGLVLHPLVGEARGDEVPAAVRFRTYEALVARYYPPRRTLLAASPAAVRHAGAREDLLHALAGKNHGITAPVVRPDHAALFDRFSPDELGVTPLRLGPAFFCKICDDLASARTCAHERGARVELSGAKVREILRAGGHLPGELVRPEVAEILRAHYLAEVQAAVPVTGPAVSRGGPPGFIVWFTGMSGAGKSTLAAALARRLSGERTLEILDGDEVRAHLSKGLGYSKADRDVNVHRIGFVARTLARHGVGVVTAAISPYADTRREVRVAAERHGLAFVEVHVSASLEALVRRDVKGLYQKALAGEVEHFTGVSDPYEAPERPDVVVRTDVETIDQSLGAIVAALQARGLVTGATPRSETTPHAGGSNGARPVPNEAAT